MTGLQRVRSLTIPECRDALGALADDLQKDGQHRRAWDLRVIIDQMKRRPAVRKTRAQSRAMTPALAKDIRDFARRNPTTSQVEIGRYFGVNPGRVSEALAGKRRPPSPAVTA